jgi:hypothetical protein
MDTSDGTISDNIEVVPVVVVSQTFPARPSSIPDIRDFVRRCLAQSPLSEQDNREIGETVSQALLEAAGPTGAISVSFRIFPDHVEVDVLKSGTQIGAAPGLNALSSLIRADEQAAGNGAPALPPVEARAAGSTGAAGGSAAVGEDPSFAEWMSGVLRREGLTMEAAARQLGVSVKTVSRWVGGTTEPRLRDLRRIRELFGEIPFSLALLDVPPGLCLPWCHGGHNSGDISVWPRVWPDADQDGPRRDGRPGRSRPDARGHQVVGAGHGAGRGRRRDRGGDGECGTRPRVADRPGGDRRRQAAQRP